MSLRDAPDEEGDASDWSDDSLQGEKMAASRGVSLRDIKRSKIVTFDGLGTRWQAEK